MVPSQVMIHLGALIDTLTGNVRPTPDKVQEISHLSQSLLVSGSISARCLQLMVGTFVLCHAKVPLCLFQLRMISIYLSRNLKQRRDDPSKKISLQELEVQEALRFWADLAEVNQRGFMAPNQTLTMNASELGWGVVLGPHRHAGLWS